MTRRKLRPDEEDLWRKVTEKAERLHPEKPFKPSDFVNKTTVRKENKRVLIRRRSEDRMRSMQRSALGRVPEVWNVYIRHSEWTVYTHTHSSMQKLNFF